MVNGLTAEERYTIDFSCDLLMERLDRVNSLLVDMWQEYFGDTKPRQLEDYEMEKIGNNLYVYTDVIFDILREYALMMGNMSFPGVGPYLDLAHRAEKAAECDALIGRVRKLIDHSSQDAATKVHTQLEAARKLPDKEAIPALRAILGEK